MKKRKIYEISVIDRTYSKTISDETKFYTSDTSLELVFKLKETEYTFDSAEIVLLNIDDRSLVTRQVSKVLDSFTYELEDDITAHYGEWRGQLRFEQAGEVYVSSPVKFRIENDLSNDRPPQLSDVQSWVSLKKYADGLVDELKQAVLDVDGIEDTFNENETERQATFETNESERAETFESNETTRQTQELAREKVEATRQQAEQVRLSAEEQRVENENQRNLTSVDEFIKLQDSIGGRNYVTKKYSAYDTRGVYACRKIAEVGEVITMKTTIKDNDVQLPSQIRFGLTVNGSDANFGFTWASPNKPVETSNKFAYFSFYPKTEEVLNAINAKYYFKIEKGAQATPYTKAPEDYAVVSKDDYYNHIKLMSDHRDEQLAELKTAITALGGA